jgi:hypothetical protein
LLPRFLFQSCEVCGPANHPQEDFGKFGDRSETQVEVFSNPALYWRITTTNGLNIAISTLVFSKYGDSEPFLLNKIWFGQVSRYSPFTVPTCEIGATIIWGLSVDWTQLKGHKYLFLRIITRF